MKISRNDAAVTVFLAGESTVTEQVDEPYAGWGQMLPQFFQPGGHLPWTGEKRGGRAPPQRLRGIQLAKYIVEGIRRNLPELATRLRPEIPRYDPLDAFQLPAIPLRETAKPA